MMVPSLPPVTAAIQFMFRTILIRIVSYNFAIWTSPFRSGQGFLGLLLLLASDMCNIVCTHLHTQSLHAAAASLIGIICYAFYVIKEYCKRKWLHCEGEGGIMSVISGSIRTAYLETYLEVRGISLRRDPQYA